MQSDTSSVLIKKYVGSASSMVVDPLYVDEIHQGLRRKEAHFNNSEWEGETGTITGYSTVSIYEI